MMPAGENRCILLYDHISVLLVRNSDSEEVQGENHRLETGWVGATEFEGWSLQDTLGHGCYGERGGSEVMYSGEAKRGRQIAT